MIRFYFAFYIAKCIQFLLRLIKKNATHLPGKIAIKICPDFLGKIKKPDKIIGVTGTNGKTTVSNLIVDLLELNNYKVLSNRLGGNINSGIASTLITGTTINNKSKYNIAVFEIDERSSLKVYPYIIPDFIICTNLFRDSIHRNAHPEYISEIINKAIPEKSTLILNADDLISASLGNNNKKVFFAIDKLDTDLKESINIINDVRICPKCHTKLKYNYVRYHHIGNAYCPNCDFKSPQANYRVKEINYKTNNIIVKNDKEEKEYELIANSIFNIYNEIAVITLLSEIGLDYLKIQEAIKKVKIVGSRYQNETINGIKVVTNMAKGQNPVACSCVFDYVKKESGNKEIILILDDFFEARDSSENLTWIYDCDFEFLNDELIDKIIIAGKRSQDFYLRLLLAGVPKEKLLKVRYEKDTPNYLSYEKGKAIYVLFEIYNINIAEQIRKDILNRLSGGGNNE